MLRTVRLFLILFTEVIMKRIYYPLLALVLGVIGFFLRTQLLSVALSPSTGMPILHHPYSYALIALTILGTLLLFFLSFFVANEAQDWYSAYHAAPLLQGLEFLSAAAFLVGTGMIFYTLFLTYLSNGGGNLLAVLFQTQPFLLFLGILTLCATAAIFFMVLRNGDSGSWSLAPLIPGFMSCVWLVLTYHSNASNPSIISFAWQVFAVSSAALAWYFTASFAFQFPRPQAATWFSLLTVMLCLIALAESVELYQKHPAHRQRRVQQDTHRISPISSTRACLSSERQALVDDYIKVSQSSAISMAE